MLVNLGVVLGTCGTFSPSYPILVVDDTAAVLLKEKKEFIAYNTYPHIKEVEKRYIVK